MGYQPKTYRKDSGDTLVIASGGTIETESGGAVEIQSGGAVEVESGGNIDIQQGANIKDSTKGVSADRIVLVEKVALAAVSGAGKVVSWQGPTGSDILITNFVLRITTAGVTGCNLDAGTATTSATTSSDNLIDGLVATGAAALGTKTFLDDVGANGKAAQTLTAGKWVTVSSAAKAASLAGSAYIYYITV